MEIQLSNRYQTIFEASYFSNGTLLISLVFWGSGVAVTIACVTGRLRLKEREGCAVIVMIVWCLFWVPVSTWWVGSNLKTGRLYTTALRNGQCEIVEGIVKVLRQQPASGHAAGDRVRIGSREFEFSYYQSTLSYNETIAHGGALVDGARVRVHYLNDAILKVEILRP